MFFDKPKQEYKQNKPPFRSTKAAFWKNETAFGECPNAVLIFCGFLFYSGEWGVVFFESKGLVCRLWLWHKEKKTIGRIVLPIVFLCVALCD
ncbi:MAG: hypothetical protein PUK03_07270 [Bacteroidales bacterium]|nr:hypothetical protein [Bacteroidales bacterium]